MDSPDARLAQLSKGFRKGYLSYEALVAQLRAWADAFPSLVHLQSIGRSVEGRDLWLLTLGPDPQRKRPAVWVDGNMHAGELAGSSAALAIAEDVLRVHLAGELPGGSPLPQAVRARLKETLVYVLPRMSPDGAEAVLRDGRYVRSNPRDRRPKSSKPRWVHRDVDGDGLALLMRREDPCGDFVAHPAAPSLLVPRAIEDEGPFYKVYPEGLIEGFDGRTIPDPYFLSDNDTDLNRNFPYSWRPEPDQAGAGRYPCSEPESRAVVDFIEAHPTIFAWLNLHTFGGVYIRPLGDAPDPKMEPSDLAVFRQIGAWGEAYAGYPMVSGFEEFVYEPDKPLYGDLTDFGYKQRGILAYVCELWDLFRVLGIPRKKPFVDHYTHLTRDELVRLAQWDASHNDSRVFRPYRPFVHPQLGPVEVGGMDVRFGVFNPPPERLEDVCEGQAAAFLRVAAMGPSVTLSSAVTPAGEGLRRVDVHIRNEGYLPTNVLESAKRLPWNEGLSLDVKADGCRLLRPTDERVDLGHLQGWGRGLFDASASIFFQRSRGSGSQREVSLLVAGAGELVLRVSGPRVGVVEARLRLD